MRYFRISSFSLLSVTGNRNELGNITHTNIYALICTQIYCYCCAIFLFLSEVKSQSLAEISRNFKSLSLLVFFVVFIQKKDH